MKRTAKVCQVTLSEKQINELSAKELSQIAGFPLQVCISAFSLRVSKFDKRLGCINGITYS